MKILVLANSSNGVYSFRNDFMCTMLKEYEVVISLPDDVCKKELEEEGCRIVYTPINRRGVNPVEDFKLILAYRKLLKEEKPDLVITYTIKPNIYGGFVAGMMKVPYIATITGLGGAFDKTGMMLKLITTMYRTGLKKAECVFFQNQENRGICEKYRIKGKTTKMVMGSGVDLKHHTYEPYPAEEKVHFLYMGRIMKERGIEEYIKAAEELAGDEVQFDIVGGHDEFYQERIEELHQRKVIQYLGFQKEVHPYLAATSAVVIPSFHEGMSNTLIEAAATGRPVIASKIFGCIEGFEEGKTGLGFTPGHADELIDAMKKFLHMSRDEREEMGRLGRKKMEKEFDRKLVTKAYMDEVHRILATK